MSRADMPVLMNRFYPTAATARAAPRGQLDFIACVGCGFTWNRAFDPELVIYDDAYENDVTGSQVFQRHLADRAADAAASVNGAIDYLEVGCGQGHFIAALAAQAGPRLRSAEGYDPAWRGADLAEPAGAVIHKAYFSARTAPARPPNLVASRHTIEHVADPVGFLRNIRRALGPRSQAAMFVETPCAAWIGDHDAVQDFFYEHCSLFTAHSLTLALAQAGFEGAAVTHVFGGQYLWAQARAQAGSGAAPRQVTASATPRATEHRGRADVVARWTDQTRAAARRGPVAVWGAGAKGVSFAVAVDPGGVLIDHVVDINPGKQGRFLPGSGLEVLAPRAACARGAKTIFVMNENYLAEIAHTTREFGMDVALVAL